MRKLQKIIIVFALSFSTLACASMRIKAVKVNGNSYVAFSDMAKYYGMTFKANGSNYALSSKFHLNCVKNKREAKLNGLKIHLSHAPTTYKGRPMISTVDFLRFIDPMVRNRSMPKRTVRRILIDPGHGGKDQGAAGKLYKEKNLTLEVGKKLAAVLKSVGYTVYMTRTGDSFPTLEQRAAMAKKYKADLFISLHGNAASKSVTGIETFIFTPKGTPSTSGTKPRKTSAKGNWYDRQNSRLAYEIQRALIINTRAKDRGVKHAQFTVLEETQVPAVLVEMGFLSNKYEERQLGSKSYQAKIVKGLAQAVIRYTKALSQGY